jgi:hypothetical protein
MVFARLKMDSVDEDANTQNGELDATVAPLIAVALNELARADQELAQALREAHCACCRHAETPPPRQG